VKLGTTPMRMLTGMARTRYGAVAALALIALTIAAPAGAQVVGYLPSRSPFRDLEYRQELTLFSGYFAPSKDDAGVAPQGGPLVGVRYEIKLGGPAMFTARVANVFSEHRVLDPVLSAGTRDLGTRSTSLWLTDVGISLNLTGQKTFHNVVPVITAGLGVASDFKGAEVEAGYKFGTQFAISMGGGLRWTPGGRFQLRADVNDYLYQIQYPLSFYQPATDNTQILSNGQAQNQWKHNATFTLGASYLFFR
jgi:hypothetical protein